MPEPEEPREPLEPQGPQGPQDPRKPEPHALTEPVVRPESSRLAESPSIEPIATPSPTQDPSPTPAPAMPAESTTPAAPAEPPTTPPVPTEPPSMSRTPAESPATAPAVTVPRAPITTSQPMLREATDQHPLGDPTGQVFVQPDDDFEPEAEPETDRPSALRTATVVSGRVILGIVVLAIVAVVVAAASLIPLPGLRSGTVAAVVTPVPTAQQLVCPGGLLRLGSSTGADATSSSAIGAPQVASGAVPGYVGARAFASSDANTGSTSSAPLLLSTPPAAAGAPATLVGGAQTESVSSSEFYGLASAPCTAIADDTWLVGGATTTGRTTLLLLANPTNVASTVSLQIYGESGQVTAAGMDGISVAAGSQRVISLAGFAPGLSSPVVHVTSSGGQIVATLEQSTVRGLTPGGIDFVAGQAAPQTTSVIPGVVIAGTAAVDTEIGQSDFQDLQSTLRLFAPSGKSAKVSITVLDENGTVTGKPITTKVSAGSVDDFALNNLSDGEYTLIVSSGVPVVASARVSTVGPAAAGSNADFAWVTTAPLLTSDTVLPVIPDVTAEIHLDNPTGSAEAVRLHTLDGHSLTATVAAHSATAVSVVSGETYELEGVTQLYASVSGQTDGGVTSYVVVPPAPGASRLRVYG